MPVSEMSRLGPGTYDDTDPEQCAESVRTALEMGCRHVDTARGYDNGAAVGEGVERADVDREEVVVVGTVSTRTLGYEDVVESTEESARKLGAGTIDPEAAPWNR